MCWAPTTSTLRGGMNSSSTGEPGLFAALRRRLLADRREARGPGLLCNHGDAKWSAVWRGHLRLAYLDNELRCNPRLTRTTVYSPPLAPSHRPLLSPHHLSGPHCHLVRPVSLPRRGWSSEYLHSEAAFNGKVDDASACLTETIHFSTH